MSRRMVKQVESEDGVHEVVRSKGEDREERSEIDASVEGLSVAVKVEKRC